MQNSKIGLVLIIFLASSHIAESKAPQRCTFERVKEFNAYNCADMKLTEIPGNLKTSTEIILASENRIKKLTKKSFNNYPKLKFLYLFNNMIKKIESGTFSQLAMLETLDLSDNSLREIPSEIFNLPSLRKLYISDNDLRNSGLANIKKPIRAPLEYLNIANTEIDTIPDFGILPLLHHLNISYNHLDNIAPEQFAPFCQLKAVDSNSTGIGACQCHKINYFIEDELKRDPLLNCGTLPKNCKLDQNSNANKTKDYLTCLSVKEELVNLKTSDFSLPSLSFSPIKCFLIGFSFLVIAMVIVHCKQKPRNRPQQIELSHDDELPVNPNSRSTLIL